MSARGGSCIDASNLTKQLESVLPPIELLQENDARVSTVHADALKL